MGIIDFNVNENPSIKQLRKCITIKVQSKRFVHNDVLDASVRQVKQFLKKNLNDPESYDGVEWSPVSQNPHTKWFIVRHKYRAKNGYGATQIYNQIFTLDSLGTVLSISDVE